jgi:uncharacterized cupredoxin-like copper-binding protein
MLRLAALSVLVVAAASHVPKPHVVTVTARDFAFELPASIPAGVTTFNFTNKGTLEHHLTIYRLDKGRTAGEALKAVIAAGRTQRPGWMHAVGGPQAISPGVVSNATVLLQPGDYFAFCEIPGPDTIPHFMKGMAKAFTVTGPPRAGSLPTADIALSLTDYDFVFSRPLTSGRHVIAVTNHGAQSHMVVMNRFPPGQGLKEFVAWGNDPKGKPAPGFTAGGVTEIPPGATVNFSDDFPRGHYGMICFIPDSKDNRPHFMHGMQREFDVR